MTKKMILHLNWVFGVYFGDATYHKFKFIKYTHIDKFVTQEYYGYDITWG